VSDRYVDHMFVTPLFVTTITEELRQNIVSELKSQRKSGKGNQKSFYYWQTNDQLFLDPEFSDIYNVIKSEITEVFNYLQIEYDDVIINNMWANITANDYFHQTHVHPNSYFSGLIYLQVSDNSAPTTFGRPGGIYTMIQPDYKEQMREQQIQYLSKPENGKMIMWDSSIPHMVSNSTDFKDDERITLAFTALPKSEVKKPYSKINFT